MEKHTYTVGSFAKLTGITEKALRHYDKKGLLIPSSYNAQGHRLYTEDNLFDLQRILTLKYLGYSLEEINEHLNHSGNSLPEALKQQEVLLVNKRDHLDEVIDTIKRTQDIIEEQREDIDNRLLLGLIHVLQNENTLKRMMESHISTDLLESIFMEDKSSEEKLELEKKVISIFHKISQYYYESKPPENIHVQNQAGRLLNSLSEVFERSQYEELENIEPESLLKSNMLSDEVAEYLSDAITIFEKSNGEKEE